MLRSTLELENYAIGATDGIIGHVRDFYFDDRAWVIRYLVVDTGSWLFGRRVLISPAAIGEPNWAGRELPVSITKQQVKDSPNIDTEKPVSRQHEIEYLGYYGYPYYWGGGGLWGEGMYPSMTLPGVGEDRSAAAFRTQQAEHDDPHLRSCEEISSYRIHASDGEIGHVQGLLVDEQTWAIRYIIVNTSNWWLGHHVLIAPQWITEVSWANAQVTVSMTRQAVQASPPYLQGTQPDRNQEAGIYRHYGRPGYWTDERRHAGKDQRL